MSVKFEFYLTVDDYDRLMNIKKDMGYNDLTGNEFARKLLEIELYRLHPQKVLNDEDLV